MIVRKCFYSIVMFCLSVATLSAKGKVIIAFSKEVIQETSIATNDNISIANRYGDVFLKTWNEPKVKIVANFTGKIEESEDLQSFYKDMAQDLLIKNDNIEVGPKVSKYQSVGVVMLGIDKRKHKLAFKNGKEYNAHELRVDYTVYIPNHHSLSVSTKYHNFTMGDYNGRVSIAHYNGAAKIGKLEGECSVSIQYGSLTLSSMPKLRLRVYDGTAQLGNVEHLELETKYSTIKIQSLSEAKIQSFQDKVEIGEIGELDYESKYTDLKCTAIKTLRANIYEGGFECGSINEARISAKYTEFSINQSRSLSFPTFYDCELDLESVEDLNVSESKYSYINVGEVISSLVLDCYDDKVKIAWIKASVNRIAISAKYGEVKLNFDQGNSHRITASLQYGEFNYPKDMYQFDKENTSNSQTNYSGKTPSGNQKASVSIKGYSADFDFKIRNS